MRAASTSPLFYWIEALMPLRPALATDVPAIHAVLRANESERSLLQRNQRDLRANWREFWVESAPCGGIRAVGALRWNAPRLAEIFSVAVLPQFQGLGLGRGVVGHLLHQAKQLLDAEIWLSTTKPDYFARFGFYKISCWELPLRTLAGKLPGVFRQPWPLWWRTCVTPFTFMKCGVLAQRRMAEPAAPQPWPLPARALQPAA
ncbi:MAG: GNAT family N-acetyltransferase [Pirellulales bacterium]|nr:GNAT family N-acetyltransferase [Pirellulales bacterium]